MDKKTRLAREIELAVLTRVAVVPQRELQQLDDAAQRERPHLRRRDTASRKASSKKKT
jgi:hypothetical protein